MTAIEQIVERCRKYSGVRWTIESETIEVHSVSPDGFNVWLTAKNPGFTAGFSAATTPRLDFEGEPLPRATLKYSAEVGAVLFETTDNPAVYPFSGDELYVRARVFSDRPQENPVEDGDLETTWVQPVKP